MKNKVITLFIAALTALSAQATTVKWLVHPEYDAVSYYSKDVFKCKKDGKYQLIDITGKKLLPQEADSITDFCDGYALVLDYIIGNASGMKIKGILEEDNTYTSVTGDYRTFYFSYFSEGLVAVADSKGKLGYLDERGRLAIPCQYDKARPFIKGWASVVTVSRKKETACYIDRFGNPLRISFHDGLLEQASSFNENGEALVGYGSELAVINTEGAVTRPNYKLKTNNPTRDYDFAFCEDCKKIIPAKNDRPTYSSEVFPFEVNKLFGYKNANDTIVKPQFPYAGQFADNCAIVAFANKYGVVTLVDDSFSSSVSSTEIVFQGDEPSSLTYSFTIPASFEPNQLTIKFNNGDGEMKPLGTGEYTHVFVPKMEKTEKSCTIKAQISTEGLILWEEERTLAVKGRSSSTLEVSRPRRVGQKADYNDELKISAYVENNTAESANVTVTFTTSPLNGENKVSSKTTFDERIAPGNKKTFTITLKVFVEETPTVTVTVDDGKQQFKNWAKVILKPFD